LKELFD
jgi:hypothetical protein